MGKMSCSYYVSQPILNWCKVASGERMVRWDVSPKDLKILLIFSPSDVRNTPTPT